MKQKHPSELSMEQLRALPFGPTQAICGASSATKELTVYIEEWMADFCEDGTGLYISDEGVFSGPVLLQDLDDFETSAMLVWSDSFELRVRRCFVEVKSLKPNGAG